jgi:hypothetical protein
MQLYWEQRRKGQRLILITDDGEQQEEVGGVRETKRGFDAFAKTFGYDPGRAEKGITTLDEAKTFVESFKPWELFVSDESLKVDADVRSEAT